VLVLLAAASFTLATSLQPMAMNFSQSGQDSVLKVLLGDARHLFAHHLFTKADIYMHSGYYPSIFDKSAQRSGNHVTDHDDDEHEKEEDFLGPPKDPLEQFGRHFMVTQHTHLENGQEKEMLPWLQLSANLDPQLTESYTVAAYWLARHLHRPAEAEKFLQQGLRANPTSYEILFALGRIYLDYDHDPSRARNVLELALKHWREQEPQQKSPDNLALDEIAGRLAQLEEEQKNYSKAIEYLRVVKTVSPIPETIQQHIDELSRKQSSGK
jgi:tetratricopeptide (TPR) repeat protein